MSVHIKNYNKILQLVFCFLLLLTCILSFTTPTAFAASNITILDDFVGTDFNINDYPVIEGDYSLQVIQIAETENRTPIIYVYQPSGASKDFRASSINISTTTGNNAEWTKYNLSYLGSYNTIYKYSVRSFPRNSADIRYYDISSISRPWDSSIDGDNENDNTVEEKAYAVGQKWTAESSDSKIVYTKEYVSVVDISNLYANSIRYINSSTFYQSACDGFFVGFSTDYEIDKLYEVDVNFSYYPYTCQIDDKNNVISDTYTAVPSASQKAVAHLTYTESTSYVLNGFTQRNFTWKWIQSSTDFISSEKSLSASAKEAISKCDWVLRYFTCDLRLAPLGGASAYLGYMVSGYTTSSVSLLRLKFLINDIVYNLGAVSDSVSGPVPGQIIDDGRVDAKSWWDKFLYWVKSIMAKIFGIDDPSSIPDWAAVLFIVAVLIISVILLMIFIPLMPIIMPFIVVVLKAIGKGLLWLGKGLLWLITAPFRLIKHLIDKKRGAA